MDLRPLHAFALELADAADSISLARFGGPVPSVAKPDGTPVTEADRAIESALRQGIEAAWPDHAILGEEEGGRIDPAVPTWVIDPIDATANFMRGIPVFATLIGLVVEGTSVVGVASAPALGERWDAFAGGGSRRDGAPVAVSAIPALEEAQVLHGGLSWYREDPRLWEVLGHLADTAWRTRGFGDFWMHLMVAGGMAEVAFERDLSPWDVAAPMCIVAEAGGRMTSFSGGSPLLDGDTLTTNGVLHDDMLRLLGDLSER